MLFKGLGGSNAGGANLPYHEPMSDPDSPWKVAPPPAPVRHHTTLGWMLWAGVLAAAGAAFFLLSRAFPGALAGSDRTEAWRLFGLLALVSSGLVATRRVRIGETLRNIAGWAAIFAVGIIAYTFRDDAGLIVQRLRSALLPDQAIATSTRSMIVGRGAEGAFLVMGAVKGAPVRFLIDTGATQIVLSPEDARRGGLDVASMRFLDSVETANGVGYGAPATVKTLSVGPIRLIDVPVSINRSPMAVSLLGLPFVHRLASFEVRGDQLFMTGP